MSKSTFRILLILCISAMPLTAMAQVTGQWRGVARGPTHIIRMMVQLSPNGLFYQHMDGGDICMQQTARGRFGAMGPDLYRFVVADYQPKRDCRGNPISSMPGWTAKLQLVGPNRLRWTDMLTGVTTEFVRAK